MRNVFSNYRGVCIADVNTPNPDKKSIMMYVMCLFQSLPHAGEDVADLDSVASEPGTPVATQPPEVAFFYFLIS